MAAISPIPADAVLAGLYELRGELTDQLERLERAQNAVEADIEALDRAILLADRRSRQKGAAQ